MFLRLIIIFFGIFFLFSKSAWATCNVTISTDGGYFYDSGGENSGYSSNEAYYKTIFPDKSGNKIAVRFTKMQLYSSDYLKVYRGFPGSSNYGEIASYNGSINHWYDDTYQWNYIESDHESGALTFYF